MSISLATHTTHCHFRPHIPYDRLNRSSLRPLRAYRPAWVPGLRTVGRGQSATRRLLAIARRLPSCRETDEKWRSKRQLAVQSTLDATRPDGRTNWLINDLRSGAGGSVHAKMALWPFPKAPISAKLARQRTPTPRGGSSPHRARKPERRKPVTTAPRFCRGNGIGPVYARTLSHYRRHPSSVTMRSRGLDGLGRMKVEAVGLALWAAGSVRGLDPSLFRARLL
jgi:hypothetical protein